MFLSVNIEVLMYQESWFLEPFFLSHRETVVDAPETNWSSGDNLLKPKTPYPKRLTCRTEYRVGRSSHPSVGSNCQGHLQSLPVRSFRCVILTRCLAVIVLVDP